MKAFVTGSTGFIGRSLVEHLLAQGHEVRVVNRPRPRQDAFLARWQAAGVDVREGDLQAWAPLADAMRGADVVCHLAWQANRMADAVAAAGSGDEQAAANLGGTDAMITACLSAGVPRFIFTSTISVYGAASIRSPQPLTENDPLLTEADATGPYWRNYAGMKIAAERMIQARLPAGTPVILRPTLVYGRGAPFAKTILQQARAETYATPYANQWIHVDDLARALLLAALSQRAGNEVINIAGAEAVSNADLMVMARTAAAGTGSLPGYTPQKPRVDINKARTVLGFEPKVPFVEGLAEMIADIAADGGAAAGGDRDPTAFRHHVAAPKQTKPEARDHHQRLIRAYEDAHQRIRKGGVYDGSDFWNFGLWSSGARTVQEAGEALVETILSFLPHKSGVILDVGCGRGGTAHHLLRYYGPAAIIGINISEEQLALCREKVPGAQFIRMDAAALNFANDAIDNLICIEAAFHFVTRDNFWREARRILKPGGRLVFSDAAMPREAPLQPPENYVSSYEEYVDRLKQCGFARCAVYEVTQECWGGFAAYAGSQAWERLRSGSSTLTDYRATLLGIRRATPEGYVIGWAEKS